MFLLHLAVHHVNIVVKVLEDHVQLLGDQEHLFEFDDIGMVQFPQRFYFAQVDTLVPSGILLFHFFDSYDLACLYIACLVDRSERTISQNLDSLVFIHLL
jgi:hypothetical protein